MTIKTPSTGQSIAFFTCERCGCPLVPMDKGAVLFDPVLALEGGTDVMFSCIDCLGDMERANPLLHVKELSEFFDLIAT